MIWNEKRMVFEIVDKIHEIDSNGDLESAQKLRGDCNKNDLTTD
jgi:hypothetical protein